MLLSVNNLHKSFGVDVILDGVTFRIGARSKVAMVGRNGTGKTTILKIITGALEPDTGQVLVAKGARVGFLRQEHAVTLGRTVLEEAESSQSEQVAMRDRLAELEKRLEDSPTEEELEEYALLHEHFMESEGYSLDRDVRTVLLRMGFHEEEFSKQTDVLSGGEKTRLALARLLLEEPDLLILDEPTNHLDLEATEWLERWINAYHGAVLLVSHDRTFLENTAAAVIDLQDGKAKSYDANFRDFLKLKAEDEARLAEVAKRQAADIAKLDEFVRRFMNSQRTAQARGRQKLMNRMIEAKVEAPKKDRGMAAGFGKAKRSGDLVVSCKDLSVGFDPEKPLFKGLDWTVQWGERWGVIGENGSGKSTLMRTILGEIEPLTGTGKLGANVQYGYFHQDVSDLDPDASPLEYLVYEAGMDTAPARDLLGRFLFSGDDVMRPVKSLSGGEKNKLVLAKLTQMNPNLLILDEPTNHLDMDSREALAGVLKEYTGTLVLVSHDRWLLDQVTQQTLDVKSAGPVVYNGPCGQYRARKPENPVVDKAKASAPTAVAQPSVNHRELSKEIARLEKLVEEIESQVSRAESRLKETEALLAGVAPDADILDLLNQHRTAQEEVDASLAAWEEQTAKLEECRRLQGPAGHEPGVTFRSVP